MRRFFGLIFVFMTIMTAQAANIGQWNAYLAYHDITDIEPAGQLIYVLSSNDLFSYNVNDKSVYAYNKTNSISDTEINYIAWNPSAKKLIIIYSNYNIDLLDNNFNVENISDYYSKAMTDDKTVNNVTINGNNAYISTGFGIIKLNMRDAEISETYNLGKNVTDCSVSGDIISAKTSDGIYQGNTIHNLVDPNNWTMTTQSVSFSDANDITTRNQTYKVAEDPNKKKFYVLNMFPYPSGAGLHVGHPLGYIASDIYARFKRQQGFNVLNPMGYDAYGLPAEQYAIQTGQHPAITTEANINRYREQLDKIGFCFDWDREVRTCEPIYYKWTQWAFQKMFNSFYCNKCRSAQPIETLIQHFEQKGTEGLDVAQSEELKFSAQEWNNWDEKRQQEVLMNYRIAYLGETMVNWCAGLGTVLANDEVVDGVSVRGGFPVVQKKMRQWCLRVSAYAQRLLDGLDTIEWTDSLKETQRNWIGRSEGAEIEFQVADSDLHFTIFTTRADTMFGVTFMVLAPESELVAQLTTPEQSKSYHCSFTVFTLV